MLVEFVYPSPILAILEDRVVMFLDATEDNLFLFFCFLDRAFSIMKTKINQQNAQINSGLIYY